MTLLSALLALEGLNSPHSLVTSMKLRLYLLHRRGRQVKVRSVSVQVEISGNELPDSLANATAARPAFPPGVASPLPYGDVILAMRSTLQAVWRENWESQLANIKIGEVTTTALRPWSYIT